MPASPASAAPRPVLRLLLTLVIFAVSWTPATAAPPGTYQLTTYLDWKDSTNDCLSAGVDAGAIVSTPTKPVDSASPPINGHVFAKCRTPETNCDALTCSGVANSRGKGLPACNNRDSFKCEMEQTSTGVIVTAVFLDRCKADGIRKFEVSPELPLGSGSIGDAQSATTGQGADMQITCTVTRVGSCAAGRAGPGGTPATMTSLAVSAKVPLQQWVSLAEAPTKHALFAIGSKDNALYWYQRVASSGALIIPSENKICHTGCTHESATLEGARAVAVPTGGKHVYVAASTTTRSCLTKFDLTGAFDSTRRRLIGAHGRRLTMAVGKAADNWCVTNSLTSSFGVAGTMALRFTIDGAFLLATYSHADTRAVVTRQRAVSVYIRNTATGALTEWFEIRDIEQNVGGLAIAPSDVIPAIPTNIYLTSWATRRGDTTAGGKGNVMWYKSSDGGRTWPERKELFTGTLTTTSIPPLGTLDYAQAIVIAPSGAFAYVLNEAVNTFGSILLLTRDSGGDLAFHSIQVRHVLELDNKWSFDWCHRVIVSTF